MRYLFPPAMALVVYKTDHLLIGLSKIPVFERGMKMFNEISTNTNVKSE